MVPVMVSPTVAVEKRMPATVLEAVEVATTAVATGGAVVTAEVETGEVARPSVLEPGAPAGGSETSSIVVDDAERGGLLPAGRFPTPTKTQVKIE